MTAASAAGVLAGIFQRGKLMANRSFYPKKKILHRETEGESQRERERDRERERERERER